MSIPVASHPRANSKPESPISTAAPTYSHPGVIELGIKRRVSACSTGASR